MNYLITLSYTMLRNLPNTLTVFRLLLIVPFLLFLYQLDYLDAFYIFLLAGFTDGLDGWIARHYNLQSPFGSFVDPLADKLLVASSFISLALIGSLPWWLVVLVFMRDLTISAGVMTWYWLVQRKLNFKPTLLSKINTTLQLMLVTLCLFELAFFEIKFYNMMPVLITITAITTAATYFDYVWTWGKKACSINQLNK